MDEPPAHLFERIQRIAVASQRLDSAYPPLTVVSRYALPEDDSILKQQFGLHYADKTNVSSAVMARVSGIKVRRNYPAGVLLMNDGRNNDFEEEGTRCFLCHRIGHYARDNRSRKHAKGSERGSSPSPSM